MNAPLNSDSQRQVADNRNATAPSNYSPSVPISIYRELASELKTTQITLDALTQQNQQLLRQNKLLRTEIQRFVQAAEQLGHFAGVLPQEPPTAPQEMFTAAPVAEPLSHPDLFAGPTSPDAAPVAPVEPPRAEPPMPERSLYGPPPEEKPRKPERPNPSSHSAIVPHPKSKRRDHRPHPASSDPNRHRLFTEQPESMRPLSKVASRSDLGNLWLATTILLVVVSAFGAGFLIMRPLLNR